MPHYFIFLLVVLGLSLMVPKDLRSDVVGRFTTTEVTLCHPASITKSGVDAREDDEFLRHFCSGPMARGNSPSLPDKEEP